MKILICNDDGMHAAQLVPLIRACRKWGDVTVAVPQTENSAKSHSIQIQKSFEIRQVTLAPDVTIWAVDSTPADCVRFAVAGLKMQFDLVISGINRGYNLGQDIMYSGTMAAATEAANRGINAVALSVSEAYYDRSVQHLDSILSFLYDNQLWNYNRLYNINIPKDPKGFRIARLSGASFNVEFIPMGDDHYFTGGSPVISDGTHPELDIDAEAAGYITVTPMTVDRTNLDVYRQLTALNL